MAGRRAGILAGGPINICIGAARPSGRAGQGAGQVGHLLQLGNNAGEGEVMQMNLYLVLIDWKYPTASAEARVVKEVEKL